MASLILVEIYSIFFQWFFLAVLKCYHPMEFRKMYLLRIFAILFQLDASINLPVMPVKFMMFDGIPMDDSFSPQEMIRKSQCGNTITNFVVLSKLLLKNSRDRDSETTSDIL